MAEINIRLDLQYKGTDFAGWQFQPNEITVQGEIERAIEQVTGKKVSVTGAGRTDAGVHALGQVANFFVDHYLPPEKYKDAINFYLPKTIIINQSGQVGPEFHARRSATWRRYRYRIDRQRTALYYDFCWEYPFLLNPEILKAVAAMFVGEHDFAAFCTVASQKEDNRCRIFESGWREEGSSLVYEIQGNRFLHSMVRSLVGLMTEMGRRDNPMDASEFETIMVSGDHTRIRQVAPSRGLCLMEVGY